MTFTTFIYQLIICSMILPTLTLFAQGVVFPDDPTYIAAVVFGYAIAIMAHENLLAFFTIQKNLLTRVLTITLLGSGFLVFAELTIPGLSIKSLDFLSETFGEIVINEQDVSKYVTILLISVMSGLIYYTLKELKKKD